jgi:hypothetical protein
MTAADRALIVRQLAEALANAWRRQHGSDDRTRTIVNSPIVNEWPTRVAPEVAQKRA